MQERFETFTVLINRISRDIRRIKIRRWLPIICGVPMCPVCTTYILWMA